MATHDISFSNEYECDMNYGSKHIFSSRDTRLPRHRIYLDPRDCAQNVMRSSHRTNYMKIVL